MSPRPGCSSPRPARRRPGGRAAAPPRSARAHRRGPSAQRDVAQALDAVRLAQHVADPAIERQRRLVALARAVVVRARERDVAQALDAVRLAQHVADPAIERQRRLVALARAVVVRARERDVAQALDAVRLAQHVADPAIERQRRLVALARAVVVRARKRDVAHAKRRLAPRGHRRSISTSGQPGPAAATVPNPENRWNSAKAIAASTTDRGSGLFSPDSNMLSMLAVSADSRATASAPPSRPHFGPSSFASPA